MAERQPVIMKDPELAALISEIYARRGESLCLTFTKLLDMLIAKIREENDTVRQHRLSENQGKVAICKQIKEYILKGIPGAV